MDAKVLEAVKVLMMSLRPGETVRFDLEVAGVVVRPGERARVATLIVTLPLVTSVVRGVTGPVEGVEVSLG